MDKLIIGLWGCFFGTTVLILAGAALAFHRSLHRISRNAALTAVAAAFFAIAFLGGLPIEDPDALARFLAALAVITSSMLTYQLFATLGLLKRRRLRQYVMLALSLVCIMVLTVGWWLPAKLFLAMGIAVGCLLALMALGTCLRSAWYGERLAWVAVTSVLAILVALLGFGWIALHRRQSVGAVHIVTAVASMYYVFTLAYVLWSRYAYLIELHAVMAYGPGYDPVTRMRSNAETGKLVSEVFERFRERPAPLGIVVLTIANLYALERLHGAAAVNSAFFVCAGRLRRLVPAHIEMGRLGKDGFLLIMQNCSSSKRIIDLARSVESRLRRSVSLNTNRDASKLETENTVWVAEIGIGVLVVSDPEVRGSGAVAIGRAMSRTAISYASRIAWLDQSSGETVEIPEVRPGQH